MVKVIVFLDHRTDRARSFDTFRHQQKVKTHTECLLLLNNEEDSVVVPLGVPVVVCLDFVWLEKKNMDKRMWYGTANDNTDGQTIVS